MTTHDSHSTYLEMQGISSSYLKDLSECPQKAIQKIHKESPAFAFGSAYHKYILENKTFSEAVSILDISMRPDQKYGMTAKNNIAWKLALEQELKAKDILLIDPKDFEMIEMMADSMMRSGYGGLLRSIIANSMTELSCYQTIEVEDTKLMAKSRFDAIWPDYSEERGIILDLKTTKDASPDGFAREIINFNYHIQAAWYCRIAEIEYGKPFMMLFAAQEKDFPFSLSVGHANDFMEQGNHMIDACLREHVMMMHLDHVPSYEVFSERPDGIIEYKMPAYGNKLLKFGNLNR